eukprot:495715-Rhodomonas_salina.2
MLEQPSLARCSAQAIRSSQVGARERCAETFQNLYGQTDALYRQGRGPEPSARQRTARHRHALPTAGCCVPKPDPAELTHREWRARTRHRRAPVV